MSRWVKPGCVAVLLSAAILLPAAVVVILLLRPSGPAMLVVEPVAVLQSAQVLSAAGEEPGELQPRFRELLPHQGGCISIVEGNGMRLLSRSAPDGELVAVARGCVNAQSLSVQEGALVMVCGMDSSPQRWVQRHHHSDLRLLETHPLAVAPPPPWDPRNASGAAFDPLQQRVVLSPSPDSLAVHALPGGELLREVDISGVGEYISDMAFSPDGALLAVGWGHGEVRLFRSDTWALEATLRPREDTAAAEVAFTPSGGLAAASFWSHFHIWSLAGDILYSDSIDGYGDNGVVIGSDGTMYQLRSGQLVVRDPSGHVTGTTQRPGYALLGGPPASLTQGFHDMVLGEGLLYVIGASRLTLTSGHLVEAPH